MYDYTFKIICIGDQKSGISNKISKFAEEAFEDTTRISIGVRFFVKEIILKYLKNKLQIWSIGEEENYRFLLPTYTMGSNGAILFVNHLTSDWAELSKYISVLRDKNGDIPIVILSLFELPNKHKSEFLFKINKLVESFNLYYFEYSINDQKQFENMFMNLTRIMIFRHLKLTISDRLKSISLGENEKFIDETIGFLIGGINDGTNSMDIKEPILQPPFKAYNGDDDFFFISYSHKDKIHIYPIIDNLQKIGLNIWYDEGIIISQRWRKAISEAIDRCSGFLVFISKNSVESDDVINEITYALELNKKKKIVIFPIYLEDTTLPGELMLALGRIQAMRKYLISNDEFYLKITEVFSSTFSLDNLKRI